MIILVSPDYRLGGLSSDTLFHVRVMVSLGLVVVFDDLLASLVNASREGYTEATGCA